jgi:hypothetical protein
MRIIIAHNAVTDADAPDERDVLVQAAAIRTALAELGHETGCCPALNLADVQQRLAERQPIWSSTRWNSLTAGAG